MGETPTAESISVTVCEHGRLTLHLYDAEGQVFATASMPAEIGADLVDDMVEQLEAYAAGALAKAEAQSDA